MSLSQGSAWGTSGTSTIAIFQTSSSKSFQTDLWPLTARSSRSKQLALWPCDLCQSKWNKLAAFGHLGKRLRSAVCHEKACNNDPVSQSVTVSQVLIDLCPPPKLGVKSNNMIHQDQCCRLTHRHFSDFWLLRLWDSGTLEVTPTCISRNCCSCHNSVRSI